MKRGLALVLALVLAIVLGACGNGSGSADTAISAGSPQGDTGALPGKTLTIAMSENWVRTDPHNPGTLNATNVLNMVYDGLVDEDHEGNYMPQLATKWDASEDGMTWVFTLREDVRFHNGQPFTAADVVCSFERLLTVENLNIKSQYWESLDYVRAIDDYTVEIGLNTPAANALNAFACTKIIPHEAYEEMGEEMFIDQECIGTGPWVFVEWLDGQYVSMVKNTDCWEPNESYYDEFICRFITENASAINAHVAGTVNAYVTVGGFNSDLISLYNGTEDRIEVFSTDTSGLEYLGLQCGGIFVDENTRIALEYAIDRDTLIATVFDGMGSAPNSVIMADKLGGNADVPNYEYDPVKATEYLAQSSYNGELITMVSNVATTKSETVLLAVSEMLNDVGFNTQVNIVESATLQEMRNTGDYDIFMVTWAMQYEMYSYINTRIRQDVHNTNLVNEEINTLIEQSNAELDPDKRDALLQQVVQLMRDQHGPYFPLVRLEAVFAVDKGITGLEIYSDGWFNFRNVSFAS